MPIHTLEDAQACLLFVQEKIWEDAKLIGSLGNGTKQVSYNDIDIYLPNFLPRGLFAKRRRVNLKRKISKLLKAKGVEDTDWGGWYFHKTMFGNVDIFFDEKEFDY